VFCDATANCRVTISLIVWTRGIATRVLILSSSAGSENIHRAFAAGASGYLLKSATPDALFRALTEAHAGIRVVPDQVAERLAKRAPESDLTPRERDVLKQLVEGGTNHDIAHALGRA
jgi:two-component system NarL family response regulator